MHRPFLRRGEGTTIYTEPTTMIVPLDWIILLVARKTARDISARTARFWPGISSLIDRSSTILAGILVDRQKHTRSSPSTHRCCMHCSLIDHVRTFHITYAGTWPAELATVDVVLHIYFHKTAALLDSIVQPHFCLPGSNKIKRPCLLYWRV